MIKDHHMVMIIPSAIFIVTSIRGMFVKDPLNAALPLMGLYLMFVVYRIEVVRLVRANEELRKILRKKQ